MKRILLVTMTLVLVGTISFAAFASDNGGGRESGQFAGPRLFKSLNLTPDQQQKLLSIRQEFQKDTQSLRFEMQKKQLELRQLWAAQSLNQGAIEAKTKEIINLRIQIVTKARAMREKAKSILTPEQLQKLDKKGFKFNPGAGSRGCCGGGRRGDCSVF